MRSFDTFSGSCTCTIHVLLVLLYWKTLTGQYSESQYTVLLAIHSVYKKAYTIMRGGGMSNARTSLHTWTCTCNGLPLCGWVYFSCQVQEYVYMVYLYRGLQLLLSRLGLKYWKSPYIQEVHVHVHCPTPYFIHVHVHVPVFPLFPSIPHITHSRMVSTHTCTCTYPVILTTYMHMYTSVTCTCTCTYWFI